MNKGFTLIELIVVTIIVGILSAISISQYARFVERGRSVEAITMLKDIRGAEISAFLDIGGYPPLEDLPLNIPTACDGEHYFYYSVQIGYGDFVATRCTEGGKSPDGTTPYTKTLTTTGEWGGTSGY